MSVRRYHRPNAFVVPRRLSLKVLDQIGQHCSNIGKAEAMKADQWTIRQRTNCREHS